MPRGIFANSPYLYPFIELARRKGINTSDYDEVGDGILKTFIKLLEQLPDQPIAEK